MQAKEALVASYRQLRAGDASGGVVYRITVRQLEALVRLSEAHARIRCSPVIEPRDVREVIRLTQRLISPPLPFYDASKPSAQGMLKQRQQSFSMTCFTGCRCMCY